LPVLHRFSIVIGISPTLFRFIGSTFSLHILKHIRRRLCLKSILKTTNDVILFVGNQGKMACGVIDPRMMDLVWTDRLEYEALLHKRPSCTQAQPTSAPSTTKPVSKAKKPSTETSVKDDGKSKF
jgi:hypothetical protein